MCTFMQCLYTAFKFTLNAKRAQRHHLDLEKVYLTRSGMLFASDGIKAYWAYPAEAPVSALFSKAFGEVKDLIKFEKIKGRVSKPSKKNGYCPQPDNAFTALGCTWAVQRAQDGKRPADIRMLHLDTPTNGFIPVGGSLVHKRSYLVHDDDSFRQVFENNQMNVLSTTKREPGISGDFELAEWPMYVPMMREVSIQPMDGRKRSILYFREGKQRACLLSITTP